MNQAKSILVIEDDDETRELMRLVLVRRGFTVHTAEDGLKGYEQAVSAQPDLIITDISMPAADGVHVVRRVRDTPAIAHVPILVTTGYGSGNATYSLTQGADAFEPKPVDPESFLATVERLLEQGS
jgi:CheY-like chemotaxis protein